MASMQKAMLMTKKIWLQSAAAAALLAAGSFAQACTLGAWLAGSAGDAIAGGPAQAEGGLSRYSGECAMQATDGYVQDNSPSDEGEMITRFYFLPEATNGTATIYETYSTKELAIDAAGTPVYRVIYDATADTIVVDATPAGGGTTTPIDVSGSAGWISIEIQWESGGTMFVWVNADATSAAVATAQATAGTALINASRLGPQNVTGTVSLIFDDVEIRRTTAVGLLLAGDANNDGSVNSGDIVAIILEFFGQQLATGTPDCNEDGNVNSGDIVCTILTFFGQN